MSTLLLFQQATVDDLNEFRHSFESDNAYLRKQSLTALATSRGAVLSIPK